MWTPDLQRKEARPVGTLIFLWVLFLLPIGTCGGIGTTKLVQTREPIAHLAAPATLESAADVELGAYVDANLDLKLVAHDNFPIGNGYVAVATGYRAYSVRDAPNVIVISSEPLVSGPIEGQICEADAKLVCGLPKKELDTYVRALQRGQKRDVRVLLANVKPGDTLWEALIGVGVAGFVLLLALLATWQLIRVARRGGPVGLTRAITLRQSPDQLRAKIRAQAGPLCRVAHDATDRIVLLMGKPAGSARLTGAREPQDIPLRVDVELGAPDAYRGTPATIRIQELLNRPPAALANVAPTDATRVAGERAAAWVVTLCESA